MRIPRKPTRSIPINDPIQAGLTFRTSAREIVAQHKARRLAALALEHQPTSLSVRSPSTSRAIRDRLS